MDCVLIQNGKAHEIWRNTLKTSLEGKLTAALLSNIVETSNNTANEGYIWNGSAFSAPPTAPPPKVSKSTKAAATWAGILIDEDPDGEEDVVWLRHNIAFKPSFELKVRRDGITTVLLTKNL